MKKKILSIFISFLFVISLNAASKFKLANGITIIFEGCQDGSVSIEAMAKKAKAPTKEFELKRQSTKENFVKNSEGIYEWNNYDLIPTEDGYSLCYNDEEIYNSKFSEEKNLLREIRTWKTAQNFYGFGEASRYVNLRNQSFTIFNESKYGDHAYLFIPFYITDTGIAVYYNANGKDKIYFQDGTDSQVYRSEYKRIQNFVRVDANAKESVSKFYEETESTCMMPKWAFGYIQSKYGYKSQEEVVALVEDFKKRNIPLSAIVLDLYWFEKMGDISWTSKTFPEPKKMDEYLEENGVKLITITEPFFTINSANYKELEKSNLLCKNDKGKIQIWRDWWCLEDKAGGALFNPLGKKAADFMGAKYSEMLESGIDGFWTDLGEPEKAPANTKYGKFIEQDFHNYYNFYWSKALFEGVKKHYPDKRLFIMSRSGYTGSGKFNVSVWSGDVGVSWTALKNQVAYGINAGLSGLPYWGSDVGGFVQEKTYPELFVRWQQFGAFTPIYRAHGTGAREPWIFTDKETEIVSKYINYRTALIPYVYSTARQTMKGLPMMRPMFFEDVTTPQEFVENQFYFGDSILVAPIVKEISMEKERTVYLPKGTWYDFESMKEVNSNGETISVKSELETIPVYIKQGAIIPCEKDGTNYLFIIPADSESSFVLYNDDGNSEQYKSGAFAETIFTLNKSSIKASTSGKDEFLCKEFTLVVPKGTKVTGEWNKSGRFMTRKVTLDELKSEVTL